MEHQISLGPITILPEWDGHILNDQEELEMLKNSEQGNIIARYDPRILVTGGSKKERSTIYYGSIKIQTPTKTFVCSPEYYRLRYIVYDSKL